MERKGEVRRPKVEGRKKAEIRRGKSEASRLEAPGLLAPVRWIVLDTSAVEELPTPGCPPSDAANNE